MTVEKEASYKSTNTYSTLNSLTEKTKNIWLVFHGIDYLSRYFINYFSKLNAAENYIIAPQAPSKYYQGKDFKHVGASWLTRENTRGDSQNILNYIDAVYENELKGFTQKLIVLGYSQGVSIATRWVASRKIPCDILVLHSGGIPNELNAADFGHLKSTTSVFYLYGNKDQYITEARETEEKLKGNKLFQDRLKVDVFDGTHEVNTDFIEKLAANSL